MGIKSLGHFRYLHFLWFLESEIFSKGATYTHIDIYCLSHSYWHLWNFSTWCKIYPEKKKPTKKTRQSNLMNHQKEKKQSNETGSVYWQLIVDKEQ